MGCPEKRARLVVEEFERWKESVGRRCQEIFPRAKGPLVALLVQFVVDVDRSKGGDGAKTLKQIRLLAEATDGSVDCGDFERFFRDLMLELFAAFRMDREFVVGLSKEVFRRLNEWPGRML